MGNTFRVINYDGDIEISIYKKANAVFKTNEYSETEDVCVYKETINIFNLLKENQELKKQYENAVADYETTMAEKEQLKKQLEECKDKINWYENFEVNKTIDKLRLKHNIQQKEFIRWLDGNTRLAPEPKKGLLNEILQKYKEIIGASVENN